MSTVEPESEGRGVSQDGRRKGNPGRVSTGEPGTGDHGVARGTTGHTGEARAAWHGGALEGGPRGSQGGRATGEHGTVAHGGNRDGAPRGNGDGVCQG